MDIKANRIVSGIGNFCIGSFWGLLGVAVFMFAQVLAMVTCLILRIDIDVYEGLYSFVAAVAAIIMVGFYAILRGGFSIKKNTLVYKDKLTAEMIFPAIIIAFGLMGIVMLYFFAADKIASFFPSVNDEIDVYNEAVDRYAVVDADKIPAIDSWLNLIAVCVLVPFVEELTFRGILLGELLRKTNPQIAIILSSLIFGLMHGLSVQIGYALISGIIIGIVYYTTHSMWATVILHGVFNFFGSGLATLLESNIFGDQSQLVDQLNIIISNLDLMLIIPAIVCVLFLCVRHKALKNNSIAMEEIKQGEESRIE